MGRFFRTDGKYLGRAYKEHLSDFGGWDQRDHAGEWVIQEKNMGERLCIDETMLHHDLFTFLSNRDGHCKKGTLIAAVKGTTVADVTEHLEKIPEESRKKVTEVAMDFSDSMMGIVKKAFPQAEIVIDRLQSTNAPAESLNSKIKGMRAQVHGVSDLSFFMFRCFTIFG